MFEPAHLATARGCQHLSLNQESVTQVSRYQFALRRPVIFWSISSTPAIGFAALLLIICVSPAHSGTITISGTLTQVSTIGILPASPLSSGSRSSENGISEGDSYTLTLRFEGSLSGPGNYRLDALTMIFDGGTTNEFQSDFASTSLDITPIDNDNVSFILFGCSTMSSPCLDGHRLDLDFVLPAGSIDGQDVKPDVIDELAQFDLLRRGTPPTDYVGTVDSYSYVSSVPEPAAFVCAGAGLMTVLLRRRLGR